MPCRTSIIVLSRVNTQASRKRASRNGISSPSRRDMHGIQDLQTTARFKQAHSPSAPRLKPPQESTDIGQAKRLMNLKAIRFLPVVVDLPPPPSAAAAPSPPPPPPPPSPSADTARPTAPFTRRWSNNREDGVAWKEDGGRKEPAVVPPPPPSPPPPRQAIVGVLSRESVRIAGRLTETERAIRDRPAYSPPTSAPSDDAGES